jgi:hypothetical protein
LHALPQSSKLDNLHILFLDLQRDDKKPWDCFFLPVPTVEGVSFLLPTHSFSLKSVGGDPMEMGTLQPWAKVKIGETQSSALTTLLLDSLPTLMGIAWL